MPPNQPLPAPRPVPLLVASSSSPTEPAAEPESEEILESTPETWTLGGRTELSGLNAIMFVILVIVAFVAGTFLLFNFITIGAGKPTPPPSLSAALPTAGSSNPASATESPGFTEPAGQTLLPSDSALNSPGDPVDVTVDGNVVGSVTVKDLRWPGRVNGAAPPSGSLWLTADVTYDASEGDITYSTSDWTLVDATHVVIEPSVSTQKTPALGSGTVVDGNKLEGFVTFLVPSDTTVVLHFASGGSTADFKVKPK
jgi:hypothetical protein